MRNRAKCRKCGDIIESFHPRDLVVCKCGEIQISGGSDAYLCWASHWENFVRIDDNDVEVSIKVQEPDPEKKKDKVVEESKPSKKDLIDMLVAMSKECERLPDAAMQQYVNQYDFYSLLTLLAALFTAT